MIIKLIFLTIIPMLSAGWLTYAYLPQIKTTWRTKDVTGIDPQFWNSITISLLLRVTSSVYVFTLTGAYGWLTMEVINLVLAGVMLVMVIKYKK